MFSVFHVSLCMCPSMVLFACDLRCVLLDFLKTVVNFGQRCSGEILLSKGQTSKSQTNVTIGAKKIFCCNTLGMH